MAQNQLSSDILNDTALLGKLANTGSQTQKARAGTTGGKSS